MTKNNPRIRGHLGEIQRQRDTGSSREGSGVKWFFLFGGVDTEVFSEMPARKEG